MNEAQAYQLVLADIAFEPTPSPILNLSDYDIVDMRSVAACYNVVSAEVQSMNAIMGEDECSYLHVLGNAEEGYSFQKLAEPYTGVFAAGNGQAASVSPARPRNSRTLRSKYVPMLEKILAGQTVQFESVEAMNSFRVFCWRKNVVIATHAPTKTAGPAGSALDTTGVIVGSPFRVVTAEELERKQIASEPNDINFGDLL